MLDLEHVRGAEASKRRAAVMISNENAAVAAGSHGRCQRWQMAFGTVLGRIEARFASQAWAVSGHGRGGSRRVDG